MKRAVNSNRPGAVSKTSTAALAGRLATRLRDALAQPETTDFHALDEILVDGVKTAQLRDLPRDQLHRLLVFALSETVLADSARRSKDWVLDAVHLFLARAASESR
jgi:hypothetical protein